MLNNVKLNNVPVAVGVAGGAVVLNGGTTTIASWGQGNVFRGTNPSGVFTQGNIPGPNKASSLLDGSGRIVGRTHPQYAAYSVSQFVSVRDLGAKGDGVTDDTAALVDIFAKVCSRSFRYPICPDFCLFSIPDARLSFSMLELTLSPTLSLFQLELRWLERLGPFLPEEDQHLAIKTTRRLSSESERLVLKEFWRLLTLFSTLSEPVSS